MDSKDKIRLINIICDCLHIASITPRELEKVPTTRRDDKKNVWNMIAKKYYKQKQIEYNQSLQMKLMFARNSHGVKQSVNEIFNKKKFKGEIKSHNSSLALEQINMEEPLKNLNQPENDNVSDNFFYKLIFNVRQHMACFFNYFHLFLLTLNLYNS